MLHTFKIYVPLDHQEVLDLQKKFSIQYTQVNKHFEGEFPGVTMSISNSGNGEWKLYMVVDAIKLINKPDITERDYEIVEKD